MVCAVQSIEVVSEKGKFTREVASYDAMYLQEN